MLNTLKDKTILVIGAHSDDEVLGVGGTIKKATKNGSLVDVCIVTDSVSQQYPDAKEKKTERSQQLRKSKSSFLMCLEKRLIFPGSCLQEDLCLFSVHFWSKTTL